MMVNRRLHRSVAQKDSNEINGMLPAVPICDPRIRGYTSQAQFRFFDLSKHLLHEMAPCS